MRTFTLYRGGNSDLLTICDENPIDLLIESEGASFYKSDQKYMVTIPISYFNEIFISPNPSREGINIIRNGIISGDFSIIANRDDLFRIVTHYDGFSHYTGIVTNSLKGKIVIQESCTPVKVIGKRKELIIKQGNQCLMTTYKVDNMQINDDEQFNCKIVSENFMRPYNNEGNTISIPDVNKLVHCDVISGGHIASVKVNSAGACDPQWDNIILYLEMPPKIAGSYDIKCDRADLSINRELSTNTTIAIDVNHFHGFFDFVIF